MNLSKPTNKQIYVICVHHESDCVFLTKEEEWEANFISYNNNLVEEVDRIDDLDFAEYEAKQYANKRNYEYTDYQEKFINSILLVTEEMLDTLDLDMKTRVALNFDLKFCGNAYLNPDNTRIDPAKVRKCINNESGETYYEFIG